MAHNPVTILIATESCTLKWKILCYVNFTLIKVRNHSKHPLSTCCEAGIVLSISHNSPVEVTCPSVMGDEFLPFYRWRPWRKPREIKQHTLLLTSFPEPRIPRVKYGDSKKLGGRWSWTASSVKEHLLALNLDTGWSGTQRLCLKGMFAVLGGCRGAL